MIKILKFTAALYLIQIIWSTNTYAGTETVIVCNPDCHPIIISTFDDSGMMPVVIDPMPNRRF